MKRFNGLDSFVDEYERHNYMLLDVVENHNYSDNGKLEFIDLLYLIGCYSCEQVRMIRQETFEVMLGLGLIEL